MVPMNAIPQLRHRLTLTEAVTGRVTGFYLRERGGSLFRRKPKTWVEVQRYASGAVASRMVTLYNRHQELRSYLAKSPWVPAHRIERFAALTRRADVLFSAYAVPNLTRTEREDVEYEGAIAAAGVIDALEALSRDLLAEAQREVADDAYAVAQRQFAALRAQAEAEDAAYGELDRTYNSFMSSTRMPELQA